MTGCSIIVDQAGHVDNHVALGYDSIPAIAPMDSTTVFLDSGIIPFNFNRADTLEYDATFDQSAGGLGPSFTEFTMKVRTNPLPDGRITVQRLPPTNPPWIKGFSSPETGTGCSSSPRTITVISGFISSLMA